MYEKLKLLAYKHLEYKLRYIPKLFLPLIHKLQAIYYFLKIRPKTQSQKDCLNMIIQSWYSCCDMEVGVLLEEVYLESKRTTKELVCPFCGDVTSENFIKDCAWLLNTETITETEYFFTCPECGNEYIIDIQKIDISPTETDWEGIPILDDIEFDVGKIGG